MQSCYINRFRSLVLAMLTEKQCFLLCTDRKRCYGVVVATAAAVVTTGGPEAVNGVRRGGRGGGCAATRPNRRPTTADQSIGACPGGRHRPSSYPPTTTTKSFAVATVITSPAPDSPTVGGERWRARRRAEMPNDTKTAAVTARKVAAEVVAAVAPTTTMKALLRPRRSVDHGDHVWWKCRRR